MHKSNLFSQIHTFFMQTSDHEGGPPYKVTVPEYISIFTVITILSLILWTWLIAIILCSYEEVLHPIGFKAIYIVENKLAIPPRKVSMLPEINMGFASFNSMMKINLCPIGLTSRISSIACFDQVRKFYPLLDLSWFCKLVP